MALMSFAAYARHRGVSKAAVTYAVQEGRISAIVDPKNGGRFIDAAQADKQWSANTQSDYMRNPKAKRVEVQPPDEPSPTKGIPSLAQSRAIKEAYLARIAKLEYESRAGTYIEAEKVKLEAFKLARMVRDALLAVPDRIASEVASEMDSRRVHLRITEELIRALEELGNNVE